ncbi:zinc ribbon domain-containing protein [Nocardia suismassiliense]|uniref:zinc-ribbon domain-containing protein n=1 Tax=Nocardia suismassiliense TaxID=2077092 RepID=UPI000D1E5AF0|nr:zinc-ribbon domain-containing protein [Nocardia suismassiliense]
MVIFGWRQYAHRLAVLTMVCTSCGNPAAHILRKLVTKFTLFFVPLIPLSTKHSLQCTWCGAESKLTKQQATELAGRAQTENVHSGQPADPSWHGQPPRSY